MTIRKKGVHHRDDAAMRSRVEAGQGRKNRVRTSTTLTAQRPPEAIRKTTAVTPARINIDQSALEHNKTTHGSYIAPERDSAARRISRTPFLKYSIYTMAPRPLVITIIVGVILTFAVLVVAIVMFARTPPPPPVAAAFESPEACAAGADVERRLADVLALVPVPPTPPPTPPSDRKSPPSASVAVAPTPSASDTVAVANASLHITLGERLLQWKQQGGAANVSEGRGGANATLLEFLRLHTLESLLALPTPKEGTLLHAAAERGRGHALEDLLEAGAPLEARDEKGATALMRAAAAGRADNLRLLLAAGANILARDKDNATALHLAAEAENGTAALAALVAAGGRAFLSAVDGRGGTALHRAAGAGRAAAVRLLAAEGGDPRARDALDTTPLIRAASSGSPGAVRALLALGADVNARDKWQSTSLHWAASSGHTAALRALLSAPGVEVDARDGESATPLHSAAKGVHMDAARVLLEAGADPAARDIAGHTPLQLCRALADDCGPLREGR